MGEQSHRAPLPAAAFAELLQTTQRAVHAFVRPLVGNSDDAHDVVQDVYVQAWRLARQGTLPFACDPRTPDGLDQTGMRRWVFTVAYRQAITLLRHRRLIPWESLDDAEEELVALVPIGHQAAAPFEEQIVEGAVLQAALARLKPADTACLLLDIVYGFSTVEIAQILDIAPEAARKRLSRALERLRVAYFAQESEQPTRVRKGAGI
jgi:RNA polymerase sigma-70 factor (ECF subfamily)